MGVKIRIKCIIKTSEIYLTFIHTKKTYCKFAIMDPSVEDTVMEEFCVFKTSLLRYSQNYFLNSKNNLHYLASIF